MVLPERRRQKIHHAQKETPATMAGVSKRASGGTDTNLVNKTCQLNEP
jgi:hypothetical protein